MTTEPGAAIRSARLDAAESMSAGRHVNAQPSQCYLNALRAIDSYPAAWYVEGYAILPDGVPFEHGWLTLDNGGEWSIIDPTISMMRRPPARYVPVLMWTRRAMQETALVARSMPFTVPGSPGFEAYAGIWTKDDLKEFWLNGLRRCFLATEGARTIPDGLAM